MIRRARVVPAEAAARAAPLFASLVGAARRRRVTREELEGRQTAERVLEQARAEARAIVERASAHAEESARRAEAEACAREAARWLARRDDELRRLGKDQDRLIALAVVLAERLLGASLELEPERIALLSRTVLAEARGPRRVTIEAHPLDAAMLREHLTSAGLDAQSLDVRESAGLARGDLLLQTDLGTIDARIALRFERLAAALRDALR